MTRQQVKQRILQGVGANALSQGIGVLIQLVALPVFLTVWGVVGYGGWLVLTSLVAFLALSDVGLATAAANEMTMCVGGGDRRAALGVFQSTWVLLTVVGGVILGGIILLAHRSPVVTWLPLQQISADTAASVIAILAAQVLIVQQTGLLHAGFRCDGHYARGQTLSALARLFEFLAQVVAAFTVGTLLSVAWAGLLARAAAFVVFWGLLRQTSPWLKLGVAHAQRAPMLRLAPSALAFLGMPLGHALGSQGMIQIVAATLGSSAVVIYTAHRTIANIVIQLIMVINNAIWPEFSTAFGSGDLRLMRDLHRAACKWALWLSVPVCVALTLVAPFALPIWSRGKVELVPALLGVFLAIVVIRSIWRTSAVVPLATNRHKLLALLFVAGNGLACAAALVLGEGWGLVGIAAATAGVDVALLAYVLSRSLKTVHDTWRSFLPVVLAFPRQSPGQRTALRDAAVCCEPERLR